MNMNTISDVLLLAYEQLFRNLMSFIRGFMGLWV